MPSRIDDGTDARTQPPEDEDIGQHVARPSDAHHRTVAEPPGSTTGGSFARHVKGHLDALLLATLAAGPRHGYGVMEALRVHSGGDFDLPTGTVYPALRRLERAGLIRSDWSIVGAAGVGPTS